MERNNIIRMAAARPQGRDATPRPVPASFDAIEARLRDDRPDLIEALRERYRGPTLIDDWHEFVDEVRGSPISHLLVAVGAIIFWTLLLVAPLWIGLLG